MKKLTYSILACLLSVQWGFAQEKSVTICQYWIDSNDRQEIRINGEEVSFVVDASGINEGMHTLNYRGAPDKPCGEDARMLTQKLLLNDT